MDQVGRKILMEVNVDFLLTEDEKRGKERMRFAIAEEVSFNPENSGTWQNLPDGRLWRLRIHSPGALSLNLGITEFSLPEGGKLWIYNLAGDHLEGPYMFDDRSHHGSLWTPAIVGDEIVLELFIPSGVAQPVLEINKVNKGYRNL